ncbi:nonribosomal peptide synthase GliP-like [Emericellopsis cladophorae]|uniref:Nonribosomal peptide synthase GliP-like n=1 Tax=Emericellopsis cladophorae TaxID=2686198 RepID=A0A9P9XV31_9HYPO|nr:nonribosomal peptide synthase GliP-like [Emericellopsis cladophorae]KAI6778359.1 nonribosomal peptide synthase GliP-like [Emericellopsis cladophorae]
MVACFLGVLKLGALYVPIDTESWSPERIKWTLQRVSAGVILNTTANEYPLHDEISYRDIEASFSPSLTQDGIVAPEKSFRPWDDIQPDDDLAYIIFTSGTTSTPKGVMVSHGALLNYTQQGGSETPFNFNATPEDQVVLIFSPAFDACTGVIFATLCNGAELRVATVTDFLHSVTLCNIVMCTPSVMSTIQDPLTCSKLRMIVLGGEAPPLSLVRKWQKALPDCEIWNFYGPTETTCASLAGRLRSNEPVHLGRPMVNSRVLLIDGDKEADYGEIYISGPGLAKGYFGNEALTAEKFVYWRGERMYRTGDFARLTPLGFEFVGRKDSLVKNRGFLVNLESQVIPLLSDDEHVASATAFMYQGRLLGFVSPSNVDTKALRRSLAAKHDAFAVPDLIRAIEALPLTPNGKIDNRALQRNLESELAAMVDADSPDMTDGKETSMLDVLKAALSTSLALPLSVVPSDQSFQELGGNSLVALQVQSFLRKRGFEVRIIDLFTQPSLSSVCDCVEKATADPSESPGLQGNDAQGPAAAGPATTTQMKMIQAGMKRPETSYMLMNFTFPHPNTAVPAEMIRNALSLVLKRHSAFRTAFDLKNGLQHIQEELNLNWNDEVSTEDQLQSAVDCRSEALRQAISVPNQSEIYTPITACHFITIPQSRSTLLMLLHHSLIDGWSLSIILNEFRSALDRRPLPAPPQYLNAALAQKVLANDFQGKRFWSELLERGLNQPPLTLLPPPAACSRQATVWSESMQLGLNLDRTTLDTKAKIRGVTPASIFYAAWALVLSHHTFTDDVSFGVVLSGRNIALPGVEQVVGPMLNTCPFPLDLGSGSTIGGLLSTTQTRLLNIMEHQWSVDEAMTQLPPGSIANTFQSIVVIEYDLPPISEACEVLSEPWKIERKDCMEFGISVLIEEEEDDKNALRVRILFDGSHYATRSIKALLTQFRDALQSLLNERNSCIQQVRESMIKEEANKSLVRATGCDALSYPKFATVKDAFEAAAAQWPDLMAVESANGSMSYQELDSAANRIAHHLRSIIGSSPGSNSSQNVVAVLTDGSIHWIVCLLAVLKAGCVCCPIDVHLPAARIDTIMEESGASVSLAANSYCALFARHREVEVMVCDDLLSTSSYPYGGLETTSSTKDVIYLVFTSGSTGVPKGVALHNHSLLLVIDHEPARLFTKPGRRNSQVYAVALVPEDFPNLDTVVLAGEPVPQSLSDAWSHKRLYNGYGPSECGPLSMMAHLQPEEPVTIGQAMPSLNVYLLDHHQCPVPPGVTGEIYLSGEQMIQRYWNSPQQTQKSFLSNPFLPGTTMYKTGDLGRWTSNGDLAYVGRIDNQVKVRGFRIELEEVERALVRADPTVQRAAAIVVDSVRIAAFVTPSSVDTSTVSFRLRNLLPAYTRPAQIIALEELPQSANLKIDRNALQNLASRYADQGDLPSSSTEKMIAQVWRKVLNTKDDYHIKREDDFLGIGAIDDHTLQEKKRYQSNTFMSYLANSSSPTDLTASHPLSQMEEEFYTWHVQSHHKSLLNTAFQFEMEGSVDVSVLKQSFNSVVAENSILRARYVSEGNSVVRRVAEHVVPPLMFTKDELNWGELQNLVDRPFDLSRDQLFRVIIWERAAGSITLVLITHHIITDKASLALLLQSVSRNYMEALSTGSGHSATRSSPVGSYIEWAQWLRQDQQSPSTSTHREKQQFWKHRLQGPWSRLPLMAKHSIGSERSSHWAILTPHCGGVKASQRIAMASTALAMKAVYGMDDMVLGLPYMNRDEPGAADLMGLFLDRLPIRLTLDGDKTSSATKWLDYTASEIHLALENQLAYYQILDAAGSRTSVFDVMVIYHWQSDALEHSLELPGTNVSGTPIRAKGAKFPLQLEFTEQEDGGLRLDVEYDGAVILPADFAALTSFLPLAIEALMRGLPPTEILSKFETQRINSRLASVDGLSFAPGKEAVVTDVRHSFPGRISAWG